MRSELAARHLALEALADPITPWPATVSASSRAGALEPICRLFGFGKSRRKG